jgi:hypothetical protein
MLREVKEADGKCTEHEQRSNQDQLILLLETILHRVVDNQRRHDEQENEVDEDQNGPDPLPNESHTQKSRN